MRFQRHAKIFRGQLDPAPIACVFFLLIIFVLLETMIYTPGVLVEIKSDSKETNNLITVTRTNTILFGDKMYKMADLKQLGVDVKGVSPNEPLHLKLEPGASTKLRDQIRDMFVLDPPVATNLIGIDDAVVIVAVNMRGQLFFENQLIDEDRLREVLGKEIKAASRESKELTLVLMGDKGVSLEVFVHLSDLAKGVGFKRVFVSARGVFAPSSVVNTKP